MTSNEIIKAVKEELKVLKEEKMNLEKAQTEILQIKEDKIDATGGTEQQIKDEEIINALREQLKILEEEKMNFETIHKTVIRKYAKRIDEQGNGMTGIGENTCFDNKEDEERNN